MKLSELAKSLQDYVNQFEDTEITSSQCILQTEDHNGPFGTTNVVAINTNPSRTTGGG